MNADSTLEAIAQIGIALAGFAGIVGALAGEKLQSGHPEVWYPFWALISSGVGVVFASLFPFLLYHFDAPDRVIWAASSALVFLVTTTNFGFFLPRILRAARSGRFRRIRVVAIPVDVANVLVIATQALNTVGLGFEQSAGGFLIGLYLLLFVSVLNFAFLLYVLLETGEASGGRGPR
jgi:hypothetical protein